ncbi:MAG TPA: hypothetical protein VGC41_07900, partial [Kofleriaceae bacterium]
ACSFSPNAAQPGDDDDDGSGSGSGSGSDMGSGSGSGSDMGSGSGSSTCFGDAPVIVCPKTLPTNDYSGGTTLFDTDTACMELSPANDAVCVIGGKTAKFTGTFIAFGSRPLVVLSLTTIDVGGELSVSSTSVRRGAGSDPANAGCTGTDPTADGGGGYGGSFGSVGGNGPGATDGAAGPIITPTTLRGGCPGGAGKPASIAQLGHGGGAVALIACTSISVLGSVDAAGEGGGGGAATNGGYGGGAGGMIVFNTPTLTVDTTTHIYANGGGGGGGGASMVAFGGTGKTAVDETDGGAFGGGGGGTGGDGGKGDSVLGGHDLLDGRAGTGGGANGGGGGGMGVITVLHATLTLADKAHFSPTP